MITVHVAGLVSRPGLVELAEGSRVADAVAAAGGLLPGARAESDQPGGSRRRRRADRRPRPRWRLFLRSVRRSPDGKIHLNLATAAELDALPGVGPVIAERIVSYP